MTLLVGVDVSSKMVEYARAQARASRSMTGCSLP